MNTRRGSLIVCVVLTLFVAGCFCPKFCVYPQSRATARPMVEELDAIAGNGGLCTRFYLNTDNEHRDLWYEDEGEDHHQGLARTHRLTSNAVYFFLTHSEMDDDNEGQLMQFRYAGPLDGEHIVEINPHTVASKEQKLYLAERHPSDLEFLPDVNNFDSGYLFVTESKNEHRLTVYCWKPGADLQWHGVIYPAHPPPAEWEPNFLFIERNNDIFYLGVAHEDGNRIKGTIYAANAKDLFPVCHKCRMKVSAFKEVGDIDVPRKDGTSQVKLVRDSLNEWYLLGFRSENGDEFGDDYVDAFRVTGWAPFRVDENPDAVITRHIKLKAGRTNFASTGTCHVEPTGRLLLLSSYRWSSDEGPGSSGYVSGVDEVPSF